MPDATARDDGGVGTRATEARSGPSDWARIESTEEFQELTRRRHRFIALAAVVTFGGFLAYLFLATFATGLMGTTVLGGVPVAFLAALSQVLMTWTVTWAYLRRADHEFAALEQRVLERAQARFTRTGEPQDPPPAEAPRAGATPTRRTTR